jgi:ribosomal protein S18 acetylase RimI-like enzyme
VTGITIATPSLRDATPFDAALISRLTREAWAGRVHPSSSAYRETEEQIAEQIREGGGLILILDSTPVGSARYSPVPGAWEVRRMGVLPAYRGRGYAELMMIAVVDRALASRVAELRVAVRHDQPRLIDFYQGLGFVLAPELEYGHANPDNPPPTVLRRPLAL